MHAAFELSRDIGEISRGCMTGVVGMFICMYIYCRTNNQNTSERSKRSNSRTVKELTEAQKAEVIYHQLNDAHSGADCSV